MESIGSGKGEGPDLNQLNNLLKNYLKKSDLDDILKLLTKCQGKNKKTKKLCKECEHSIV